LLPAIVAAALVPALTMVSQLFLWAESSPADAFVGYPSSSQEVSPRDDSLVAMEHGNRRQNKYYYRKKNHIRYRSAYVKDAAQRLRQDMWQFTWLRNPPLEKWSQTLKVSFLEGEDTAATEDELMAYFTTDDYKPEAVVVGHTLPHDPLAKAYVHFATPEECQKARKEKDGGAVGKASEVKLSHVDEKKWIRVRDGITIAGGHRTGKMKAYGDQVMPEWTEEGIFVETGFRTNPVYPEDLQLPKKVYEKK